MMDVRGTPVLYGPEAKAHGAENSFVLAWATVDGLNALNLQPADVRPMLAHLVE